MYLEGLHWKFVVANGAASKQQQTARKAEAAVTAVPTRHCSPPFTLARLLAKDELCPGTSSVVIAALLELTDVRSDKARNAESEGRRRRRSQRSTAKQQQDSQSPSRKEVQCSNSEQLTTLANQQLAFTCFCNVLLAKPTTGERKGQRNKTTSSPRLTALGIQ